MVNFNYFNLFKLFCCNFYFPKYISWKCAYCTSARSIVLGKPTYDSFDENTFIEVNDILKIQLYFWKTSKMMFSKKAITLEAT
jgi:hypothetical protein